MVIDIKVLVYRLFKLYVIVHLIIFKVYGAYLFGALVTDIQLVNDLGYTHGSVERL